MDFFFLAAWQQILAGLVSLGEKEQRYLLKYLQKYPAQAFSGYHGAQLTQAHTSYLPVSVPKKASTHIRTRRPTRKTIWLKLQGTTNYLSRVRSFQYMLLWIVSCDPAVKSLKYRVPAV
ncbi:hypothetical protein F4823DRAFT_187093 [Ustulina deusta]|nr:hypothetical protein F4823DRAFT_187093 [Ustulina deusta]